MAETVNGNSTVNVDTPGSMIEDIGVGAMRNNTIVAKLPGGQYVTPGEYYDTLTVTLEY